MAIITQLLVLTIMTCFRSAFKLGVQSEMDQHAARKTIIAAQVTALFLSSLPSHWKTLLAKTEQPRAGFSVHLVYIKNKYCMSHKFVCPGLNIAVVKPQ